MRRYRNIRFAKDETAYEYFDDVLGNVDKAGDHIAYALAEYTKAMKLLDGASRDKYIDYNNQKYVRDIYQTLKILDKEIRNVLRINNNAQADVVEIKRKL